MPSNLDPAEPVAIEQEEALQSVPPISEKGQHRNRGGKEERNKTKERRMSSVKEKKRNKINGRRNEKMKQNTCNWNLNDPLKASNASLPLTRSVRLR